MKAIKHVIEIIAGLIVLSALLALIGFSIGYGWNLAQVLFNA